jgi:hypothetical protein
MNLNIPVTIDGHVLIRNKLNRSQVFLDKHNAVHSQNMSRVIARALAHETNSWIYRIAFGNGGSQIDAVGNVILNPPNDGSDGSWQSTLYNETYSEVVDDISTEVGLDPGSSDQNNTRPGGGSDPSDDPTPDSVISQEVGLKSNVVVTCFINEHEPSGEAISSSSTFTNSQNCFVFDEMGLYSPGLPAKATNGFSTVNVGNKTSVDQIPLTPNTTLTLTITVDGTLYTATVAIPASGSGPSGQITFGDFCEGLNTGTWLVGDASLATVLYTYITDNTNGTYPSILNAQSFGFLIFQSRTSGSTSTVLVGCNASTPTDLMNVLTSGVCSSCNITVVSGENAGVQNDPINPANERERLLTHITFQPIPKAADIILEVIYTLTVSVARTNDSQTEINNT